MKNRKVISIFFAILCGLILFSLIGIWKVEEIYDAIKAVRTEMAERKACEYRNEELLDLSDLPPLEKDADAWHCRYSVIAHSGG